MKGEINEMENKAKSSQKKKKPNKINDIINMLK